MMRLKPFSDSYMIFVIFTIYMFRKNQAKIEDVRVLTSFWYMVAIAIKFNEVIGLKCTSLISFLMYTLAKI